MSKFKVGDKLRVRPGYSTEYFSEGDYVVVTEMRSDDVMVSPGRENWWYLENRFELVEAAKPSHGFKIGDLVRCINDRFTKPQLIAGCDYEVVGVSPDVINLKGIKDAYAYERFELVKVAQPKSAHVFKSGDKVRCIDDSRQLTINAGCVYSVLEINAADYVILSEVTGGYMPSRFELVNTAQSNPALNGITIGCVVEGTNTVMNDFGKRFTVSDIKDNWLYFDGATAASGDGKNYSRFKVVYTPGSSTGSVSTGDIYDDVTQAQVVNTFTTLGEQDMSIDTTVAVQNKTYIFGQDADTVSVDTIFNHITRLEAEVAKYDSIKAKPKAIKAKVDALNAEIAELVKFSDEKFAAE